MNFSRPARLASALEQLGDHDWTILAGGTDYYPALRSEPPGGSVIDISAIDELRGIEQTDQHFRFGALTTWSEIVKADLPPAFAALQQAALEVGSVQIQNRATIAGNLCNASPAADGVPPLLVLDASVELQSTHGIRVVALSDFIQGNRRTVRNRDELVSAITVPSTACAGHSAFTKLGARKFLVISIGMVAARVVLTGNRITQMAVAIGSCSEVAVRLPQVEALFANLPVAADIAMLVDHSHVTELTPIDDIRATAGYRRDSALQLIRSTIAASVAVASVGAVS